MLAHTYVESTMMIEIHRQRTPALLLDWCTAVSALCVSCLNQPAHVACIHVYTTSCIHVYTTSCIHVYTCILDES